MFVPADGGEVVVDLAVGDPVGRLDGHFNRAHRLVFARGEPEGHRHGGNHCYDYFLHSMMGFICFFFLTLLLAFYCVALYPIAKIIISRLEKYGLSY